MILAHHPVTCSTTIAWSSISTLQFESKLVVSLVAYWRPRRPEIKCHQHHDPICTHPGGQIWQAGISISSHTIGGRPGGPGRPIAPGAPTEERLLESHLHLLTRFSWRSCNGLLSDVDFNTLTHLAVQLDPTSTSNVVSRLIECLI